MEKKAWMKSVLALALCLVLFGCSKDDDELTAEEQYNEIFNALVLGGSHFDATQNWSTVATTQVSVSIDYADDDTYTVYITETPPLLDANAVYIGMAKVRSGASKTITIARPNTTAMLYASCYDSQNHAVCKPFAVTATGGSVSFSGKSVASTPVNSEARTRATSGNVWSVPTESMPDVSSYTTGNLTEMREVYNEPGGIDGGSHRFLIGGAYQGLISILDQYSGQSVYVAGVWTLTYDQRVTKGNVIVVGNGARINIPRDFKLSTYTAEAGDTPGRIIIMPGGEIAGEGTLDLQSRSGTYHYNGGYISADRIVLYGATLYNAGTIGSMFLPSTVVEGNTDTPSLPGALINQGTANLKQTVTPGLSLQNAGRINVSGELALSSDARMDDGSYIECGSLNLTGGNNGNTLFMGNAAYLNCMGNISVDHYGIWGPSGNNYRENAILAVKGCDACVTADGLPSTYLLDHVEMIVPETYTTFNGTNTDAPDVQLLYNWMNGSGNTLLSSDNYEWTTLENGEYVYAGKPGTTFRSRDVDASRQTCSYGFSPSYNSDDIGILPEDVHFGMAVDKVPTTGGIYYAYEVVDKSMPTKDFDFNDVVLRFNTPTDNGDGSYTVQMQIMAVGTQLATRVLLNDTTQLGEEVHQAIGVGVGNVANVETRNRVFRAFDTLTFYDPDIRLVDLPVTISATQTDGYQNDYEEVVDGRDEIGKAPVRLTVSGDTRGNWYWAKEGIHVAYAFPQFISWSTAATSLPAQQWYLRANGDTQRLISY